MFKALLAAVTAFILLDTAGSTYQILYAMGDAVFYFLPMIIGYTAAKKFGGNPTLVLGLAGLLLYPNFMTLLGGEAAVTFFGIPVTAFTYSSSVVPIILIALVEAKLEKLKIAYRYEKRLLALVTTLMLMVSASTAVYASDGFNKAVFDNAPDVFVTKDDMTGDLMAASESLLGSKRIVIPETGGGYVQVYSGVSISDDMNLNVLIFKYHADNWAFIDSIIIKIR